MNSLPLAVSFHAGLMARFSAIAVANLLKLSLDQQAGHDEFVNHSPYGRPLDAADFIALVEMKLGRKVRPGKRGRKPHAGGWVDMGYSYHVPVMCPISPGCDIMQCALCP